MPLDLTRSGVRRGLGRLVRNLRAGARVACLRPVRPGAFRLGVGQIALLAIAATAASAIAVWAMVEPPRVFDLRGFHGEAIWLLILLTLAVAARAWGHPAPTPLLLGGLLAAQPLYSLATGVLFVGVTTIPDGAYTTMAVAWGVLMVLVVVWAMRLAYQVLCLFDGPEASPARRRRWAGLSTVFVAAWMTLDMVAPTTSWWDTDWSSYDSGWEPEEPVDAEALFYAQPALVATAGDALRSERPGITDLYFVGFGADASQSVFLREVRYARELFDRRFDTGARSVALVNHRETTEELPLASATNLERSLADVGERMNPEEDILFLFLTGHGSADHEIAVRFRPLPLNRLGPERIADAIEAAGIRYRVVVVSACYSGGFLDALADEDSMILTASAADRTSFGCSEEAEFTYFGRALFGEALEATRSFEDAFAIARAAIEEREAAEGLEASNPQIHVGRGIAERLSRLEARLGDVGATRVAGASP